MQIRRQALADALLDFTSASDLEQWLATYGHADPA